IEYPNAYYHVSNKSDRTTGLFPSRDCYSAFLEGVGLSAARFNVEVLAWCLLRGEYHLLVKTPEANLSRFMRQVDGLYTQYYQRTRKRRGSVFRSRYKSVLFQPDPWLAPLSRYIHNLPRAARQNPHAWLWSSLNLYLGELDPSQGVPENQPALAVDEVLEQFGTGRSARDAYDDFVRAGSDRSLVHFYSKKNLLSVLGDENFKARAKALSELAPARGVQRSAAAARRPSATRIVSSVADIFNVSDHSILRAARGPGTKNVPRWVAMYLCQEVGGITLQDIATRFGLQRYGTVSTTIGKLKGEFVENPPLESRVQRMRQQLYG
ncbi:MAG TPA: hypothetical protein GX696_01575, partial [Pseudomonadaceae bacterium]|nr:hypothetical protein [Pseudomonadaceae bacterium]